MHAIKNLGKGRHTFLIKGKNGIGKTVLAVQCALKAEVSYTKMISTDRFLGLNEGQIVSQIVAMFDDAEKC